MKRSRAGRAGAGGASMSCRAGYAAGIVRECRLGYSTAGRVLAAGGKSRYKRRAGPLTLGEGGKGAHDDEAAGQGDGPGEEHESLVHGGRWWWVLRAVPAARGGGEGVWIEAATGMACRKPPQEPGGEGEVMMSARAEGESQSPPRRAGAQQRGGSGEMEQERTAVGAAPPGSCDSFRASPTLEDVR